MPASLRRVRVQTLALALGACALVLHVLAPAPAHDATELDRDSIRRAVVEQFVPTARRCYNRLLREDPSAAGRVTLDFVIARRDDRGVVVEAEIGDDPDIEAPSFHACLLDGIRAVVFEPPSEGDEVRVIYPFIFRPGPDGLGIAELGD